MQKGLQGVLGPLTEDDDAEKLKETKQGINTIETACLAAIQGLQVYRLHSKLPSVQTGFQPVRNEDA